MHGEFVNMDYVIMQLNEEEEEGGARGGRGGGRRKKDEVGMRLLHS